MQPETPFDRIIALAGIMFDAPMAGIWTNGRCEAALGPVLPVVPDGNQATCMADLGMTVAPFARFFASAPLVSVDGLALGTLYVADTKARFATERQLTALADLAGMAATTLERHRLTQLTRELTEARDQLALLVTTDELTQVANKRGLNQRLSLLSAEGARGRRFAVVMVDLDHFKKLNDTYGHAAGDRALHDVAQLLTRQVRATDLVARYGGEEFCVLLADVDGPTALALAERLRVAIASLAGPTPLTASFGVSLCTSPERANTATLLEEADRALYRAKRAGRNRVAMARRSMPAARVAA